MHFDLAVVLFFIIFASVFRSESHLLPEIYLIIYELSESELSGISESALDEATAADEQKKLKQALSQAEALGIAADKAIDSGE